MGNHRVRMTGVLGSTMLSAAVCHAQVLINEVYLDPPGARDQEYEFIELYGRPGHPLDGYLLVLVTQDHTGDATVNEAYELDGFELGPDGFFVVFPTERLLINRWAERETSGFLPGPADRFSSSRLTHAWLNGARYDIAQAAEVFFMDDNGIALTDARGFDQAGLLGRERIGTVQLIRQRPGAGVYDPAIGVRFHELDYAWLKGLPLNQSQVTDAQGAPRVDVRVTHAQRQHEVTDAPIAPYQVVDEVSWTDGLAPVAALEASSVAQTRLTDTPGALVRLGPPGTRVVEGHRTVLIDLDENGSADCYRVEPTSIAEESFVIGSTVFDPGVAAGSADDNDRVDGARLMQGPTALGAIAVANPGVDPEPHPAGPFGLGRCAGDNAPGPFLFDDLDASGMPLTPATFNDHPSRAAVRQFRFVGAGFPELPPGFAGVAIPVGDLDFDGDVDAGDVSIAWAEFAVGATAGDLAPVAGLGARARSGDGVQAYVYQGARYQRFLMLSALVDDGPAITQADLDALAAVAGAAPLCPGDFDASGGEPNVADVRAFEVLFSNGQAAVMQQATPDDLADFMDWREALSRLAAGCP